MSVFFSQSGGIFHFQNGYFDGPKAHDLLVFFAVLIFFASPIILYRPGGVYTVFAYARYTR